MCFSIHYIQLQRSRSAVYMWQSPKSYVKYTLTQLQQVCEVGRMAQKYTAGSIRGVEWQVGIEELQ